MTSDELQRHTAALWEILCQYVRDNGLEKTTTGILIVRELPTQKDVQPAHVLMYAGDTREAVAAMTRASMSELKRAGVVGGAKGKG